MSMRVEINCPRLFLNTWVDSALVMDLIAAGRQVLGLARSAFRLWPADLPGPCQ
jgi:hypothetical protein